MTVAGQTIYIATSPKDIGGVWRNTETISMNPITNDMYTWCGFSEKTRRVLFDPHPLARYNSGNARPLSPTQMVIELHHQQLQPGPRLKQLVEQKVLPNILEHLDFSKRTHPAVVSRSDQSFVVSLLNLSIDVFITGETEVFFDPLLLQNSPNLVKSFTHWEYANWKFLFQLPDFVSQDMLSAKRSIVDAFKNYFKSSRDARPDSVFFIDALEDMLREVGLNEEEMANFMLLHYWA